MYKDHRITVVIPCLNEEEGIRRVLEDLPSFVDEVTLRRLSVGAATADIRIRRLGHDVSLEILESRGSKLQISMLSAR